LRDSEKRGCKKKLTGAVFKEKEEGGRLCVLLYKYQEWGSRLQFTAQKPNTKKGMGEGKSIRLDEAQLSHRRGGTQLILRKVGRSKKC